MTREGRKREGGTISFILILGVALRVTPVHCRPGSWIGNGGGEETRKRGGETLCRKLRRARVQGRRHEIPVVRHHETRLAEQGKERRGKKKKEKKSILNFSKPEDFYASALTKWDTPQLGLGYERGRKKGGKKKGEKGDPFWRPSACKGKEVVLSVAIWSLRGLL